MPGRVLLAALALASVALAAACSSSSNTTQQASAPPPATAPPGSTAPISATSSPLSTTKSGLTAPALDAASPALAKYDRATLTAALNLSTHLAYVSVADPALLGKTTAHASIADYAAVTRYLTPQGVRYLTGYIKDQDRNGQHEILAGELALASTPVAKGAGSAAQKTIGTRFSAPFSPFNYRAVISPTVRLGDDGISMLVTGSCSVQIPGTQNGKKVLVTLARKSFTYSVQPSPSKAYPVGVSGWVSYSTASYAAG